MSTQQLAPAPAPRRDSTRVMAIVALVLSVVALVAPVGMVAAPMLLFGLGGPDESFEVTGDGAFGGPGSQGGMSGRTDTVSGPFIAGRALAEVLGSGPSLLDGVICPDTADVRPGTTILCSASGGSTYVVVRVTDSDGAYRADWFSPDTSGD